MWAMLLRRLGDVLDQVGVATRMHVDMYTNFEQAILWRSLFHLPLTQITKTFTDQALCLRCLFANDRSDHVR